MKLSQNFPFLFILLNSNNATILQVHLFFDTQNASKYISNALTVLVNILKMCSAYSAAMKVAEELSYSLECEYRIQ